MALCYADDACLNKPLQAGVALIHTATQLVIKLGHPTVADVIPETPAILQPEDLQTLCGGSIQNHLLKLTQKWSSRYCENHPRN